jgi:hypothetical protein
MGTVWRRESPGGGTKGDVGVNMIKVTYLHA